MDLKRCDRTRYPEFLRKLHEAFDYRPKEWFQKNLTNCTPYPDFATDEEIANHLLCVEGGEIIGGLGAYPADWAVSDIYGNRATVGAYGIGQVFCVAKHRNRGVMTALMNETERHMRSQDRTVGFLGGDRHRYGHFGYGFGVNSVRYEFRKTRFLQSKDAAGLVVRQAGANDIDELNEMYDTLPSRILRDARAWERQMKRHNFKWAIALLDGKKACAAYETPERVAELCGDLDAAAALLAHLFGQCGTDKLTVSHPMQNGINSEIGRMLHDNASMIAVESTGLVSIIDAWGLLEKMPRILDEIPVTLKDLAPDRRTELARRLFGYAHRPLPECARGLEKTAPLCAFISEADHI